MKLRVMDLFSGIGGFSLGLERAGMETVAFCEYDEKARKVLKKHWPDVPIHEDIRRLDGKQYRGAIDVICGGDPCQENSNARRNGKSEPSPAIHFLRIIAECRPRIVLRENPSVVRKGAPWPWWRFRKELERIGYAVLPFRLRSCCAGADHRRERLFLLAELPDADGKGLQGNEREVLARKIEGGQNPDIARPDRRHSAPRVRRKLDGVRGGAHRLRMIGNSVDPYAVEIIGRAIVGCNRVSNLEAK